jgi:hypothetical protein
MLPGGGRGGGKRLQSSSAAPAASSSSTADSTAETPGAAERRMLPGGGRGGGKRLLSASNSTIGVSASYSSTHGLNLPGVSRMLPGGGRGGGKRLLQQPPGRRTALSLASVSVGSSPHRVQPRSSRTGAHHVPQRSKCSWWERVVSLLELLVRANENRKWC